MIDASLTKEDALSEKQGILMDKNDGLKGAELLKLGRKLRGMTQDEVASIYGVSRSTYQRWENGASAVSYDDLCAICVGVFKLELDNLRGMKHAA